MSEQIGFLKFSAMKNNAKLAELIRAKGLKKDVGFTFSVPSGFTCPLAELCLSKANRETGKIKDGPKTQFRCFSASQEALFPLVRAQRWYNFDQLRKAGDAESMATLIDLSLPEKARLVRIHVGGDFFSQEYFDAWRIMAERRPEVTFYAYTKSLTFWERRLGEIPSNFILTASDGGRRDDLIAKYNLRHARVVGSEEEARALGLEIDHDDSHAARPGPSFALLIHGPQPAKSQAGRDVRKLNGKGSYGAKSKAKQAKQAQPVFEEWEMEDAEW